MEIQTTINSTGKENNEKGKTFTERKTNGINGMGWMKTDWFLECMSPGQIGNDGRWEMGDGGEGSKSVDEESDEWMDKI